MATLQERLERLPLPLFLRILRLVGDGHAAELATRTQNLSRELFEIIKTLTMYELCRHATYQRIDRHWNVPAILQLTRIDRAHSRRPFFHNARFYGNIEEIVIWLDRLPDDFRANLHKIYAFATPQTLRPTPRCFGLSGSFLGRFPLPGTFRFEGQGPGGHHGYEIEVFMSEKQMLRRMYPEPLPRSFKHAASLDRFSMAVFDDCFVVSDPFWLRASDEVEEEEEVEEEHAFCPYCNQ